MYAYSASQFIADKYNASEVQFILPTAADPTFLPGYDGHLQNFRSTVSLVNLWNEQLEFRAAQWSRGLIYLYDINAFMIEQIRLFQLFAAGISDSAELGEDDLYWENVNAACIRNTIKCADPENWLFWCGL